jgi:hypothetical protein
MSEKDDGSFARARRGDLHELQMKLLSSAPLTPWERHILFEVLDGAKNRSRGRQPNWDIENLAKCLALYTHLYELEGAPTESAVAAAAALYRVSRSTVFAARKRWLPYCRDAIDASREKWPPEVRRLLLGHFFGGPDFQSS